MYSGRKVFPKGQRIADPDLMVPVYDLDWHNGLQDYFFLWDEYTWATGNVTFTPRQSFLCVVFMYCGRTLMSFQ